MHELLAAITQWRPGTTEFVLFTKADWDRIRSTVPDTDAFNDIELLPLVIDGDDAVLSDGDTPLWREHYAAMDAELDEDLLPKGQDYRRSQ